MNVALVDELRHLVASTRRLHVDQLAAPPVAEANPARGPGEEGVVAAAAYVEAGMDARAPLPHEDGARIDKRAVEHLDSQPLAL
jgi:hypothetical protein